MTDCLRVMVAAQSSPSFWAWTPYSAACSTVRATDAVSSSSLAGMQPTFRQVPPSRPRSTRAM